jgi:hypothetical protein
MKKHHLWIAIVALALAALSCQFLLPDETPSIPPSTRQASPPMATSLVPVTPGSPLPSGLIRAPVTEADRSTAKAIAQANPGIRDLRDLAIRLKGVAADTPEIACTSSPDYPVGTTRTFEAQNQSTNASFQVKTTLRYKNDVVYIWVAEKVQADDAKIKQAADFFAEKIYPTNRALLGSERTPGIDCDPHISILNTPGLGGAAGYVAGKDAVTKAVRPDSNEMEMFYMNTDAFGGVGGTSYLSTLAHEFQHVIAGNTHKNLDTWMNEGFSDLAIYLNGFDVGRHSQAFLAAPNTQLNAWDELARSVPHYGASYLFVTYFYSRFGADGTKTLIADQNNGLTAIDNTLAKKPGMTADDLFADWQIANYLNDPQVASGQFAYKDLKFNKPKVERTIDQFPFAADSAVNHFGSQYFVLKGSRDVKISFTGATKARLIGAEPRGGQTMWYSGRGDDSVFSLSREFDLASAPSATLKFWTWFDIEKDWDYFYVEVSTDGKTWKILETPGSTDTNPNGNSYGWARTGKSGGKKDAAEWIEASVDLKEYTGKKILLRFEYITDDALNYPGVALGEIRLPEINYAYNADSGEGGWKAQGFIRTNNLTPEKYSVQLISFGADGATQASRLPLADDQTGQWQVPLSQLKNAVLALSALARTTTEPAPYRLTISD